MNTMNEGCFTYKLEIDRKHGILVDEEGRRYLIDTGSPISYSDGPLTLCGKNQESNTGAMLNHIRKISNLDIDGLIGMSTLRQYHVLFDYPHGQIKLSTKAFDIPGCKMKIQTVLGMAIFFEANLDGIDKPRRIILDSGAPISYVNPELVKFYAPVDSIKDFHPEIGEFTVPLYPEIQMSLGDGYNLPVSFGVLPSTSLVSLSTTMLADAIVGYDLLSKGMVELSFTDHTMTLNI